MGFNDQNNLIIYKKSIITSNLVITEIKKHLFLKRRVNDQILSHRPFV